MTDELSERHDAATNREISVAFVTYSGRVEAQYLNSEEGRLLGRCTMCAVPQRGDWIAYGQNETSTATYEVVQHDWTIIPPLGEVSVDLRLVKVHDQ